MSSYSEYLVSCWGVSCVASLASLASLWHAGACVAYPATRNGDAEPHVWYARSGARPTSRTLVTLARDADVRIPGLFGLPAFAPASADGPARSDGGDAPEATDKPREHARPRSASANVRRDYRDYPSD